MRGLIAFVTTLLGLTPHASGFGGDNFEIETIMAGGARGNELNALADIDGDGDLDVIGTRFSQGSVWYENLGEGQFGPSRFVGEDRIVGSLAGLDIDGDGDTDILGGTHSGAIWIENLDGLGQFAPPQVIASRGESVSNRDLQIAHGDIDGDGDIDVVHLDRVLFRLRKSINDGTGSFTEGDLGGPEIESAYDLRSLDLVDLRGDGDLDLLVSIWNYSSGTGHLEFYENEDGTGRFSGAVTLAELEKPMTQTGTGDIDGDGDIDVLGLAALPESLLLFERLAENEFAAPEIITTSVSNFTMFEMVDLDGDLDLDILLAGGGRKVLENIDGAGNFAVAEETSAHFNASQFASVGDLDGDGLVDIVGCRSGAQVWHRNLGDIEGFADPAFVSELRGYVNSMFAADLDGDSDPDLCYAWSQGAAILFQSYDSLEGDFESPKVVSSVVPGAGQVAGGDLDGDGDTDILFRDSIGIGWFENMDGLGTFGPRKSVVAVADNFPNPWNMSTADIDADGDLDILASSNGDDESGESRTRIVWFENEDGTGNFGPPMDAISYNWNRHPTVAQGDFNGDGKVDILLSLSGDVSWFENLGDGNFGPAQNLHTALDYVAFMKLLVSDLDGDGDEDLVIGERWKGNRVSWLENLDGEGNFSSAMSIVEGERIAQSGPPMAVPFVGDFDNDGDKDLFTLTEDPIYWYENEGDEEFGIIHTYVTPGVRPSTDDPARSVAVVLDLDADGDTDIITAGDFIRLYRGTNDPIRLECVPEEVHESDLSATVRFQLSGVLNKDLKLGYKTVDLPLAERTVAYTPVEGIMVIPAGSLEGAIGIPLGESDGILRHGSELTLELSPVIVGEFPREFGLPRFIAISVTDSDAAPADSPMTHVVSNLDDSGSGSLRGAIENAVDGDRIEFNTELAGLRISLAGSPLVIRNNLVIDASALSGGITVSGGGASRVMDIRADTTVLLDSLILRDGLAPMGAEGIAPVGGISGIPGGKGGAGGGILNRGNTTIVGCTLMENQAGEAGPGSGEFRLTDAWMGTVDGDGGDGGGIFNSGNLTILNTTLSGNLTGVASKTRSGEGGGIYNAGDLTLVHATLYHNQVDQSYRWGTGRGIFCAEGSNLMLENSLIASVGFSNVGDADIVNEGNPVQARGANFIGNIAWMEDVPGTVYGGNPFLYEKPVPHLPRPDSPLIDAAQLLPSTPSHDQRGVPRDANPDIGAVEFSVTAPEPKTHFVTSAADTGPGSLRQVLAASSPRDTILFDIELSGKVITLEEALFIDRDIVIDASNLPTGIRIQIRGYRERTIEVVPLVNATLVGIEISRDSEVDLDNGGIRNEGNLTLVDCMIRGNRPSDLSGFGGGIANYGTLEMYGCMVYDNTTSLRYDNFGAGRPGGGIYNEGSATLTNCTVANNHAADGGYLPPEPEYGFPEEHGDGGSGGGIYNESGGSVRLIQTTVTGNSHGKGDGGFPDGSGGGIYGEGFTLENSIVTGNLEDDNHSHAFTARGNNLTSGDPMLASIGDYGGPTPTLRPLPNSPAIGGGKPLASTPKSDQRGYLRPSAFDPRPDLGAVEYSIVHDGPLIRSFLADRERVVPNEPFGLTWNVVGADELHLAPVGGPISPTLAATTVALPEGFSLNSPLYSSDLLIPEGSVWRFHDQDQNLGNSWRQSSYDDSAWLEGAGEIGYGTGRFWTLLEGVGSPTVYFRKSFQVGSLDADAPLTLRLKVNDGAVVYLNGIEILRENMPAGWIYHTTHASAPAAESSEHEWTSHQLGAAGDFLKEGENTIAISVHNESLESPNLAFNLELRYSAPLLIERRSEWKYDDRAIDHGAAWRDPDFDDSSWSQGRGEIGFGEGDEKTPMARNGQPTIYFRRTFEVGTFDSGRQLVLRLNRDDGAVVYVNGREILRDNMPPGEITFDTLASEIVYFDELRYHNFPLGDAGAILQPGTNTIAVSLHNQGLESSDISFDLELGYVPDVRPKERLVLTARHGGVATEASVLVEVDDRSRADGDNDGLADVWEMRFFNNLSQGAHDDGDGDGFFNESEFQAGSVPIDGDSVPSFEASMRIEMGADGIHLSSGRPSYEGARALLQYSSDMRTGTWIELGDFVESDGIWKFIDREPERVGLNNGYYRALLLPDSP